MEEKVVDVIIPTYKPDEKLKLLIRRLEKQSYPINSIHIINTDTGSFPGDIEAMGDNIKVTHIRPEIFDHGGTRHQGAQMSEADILIYMTQDAVPVNEYLIAELAKVFEDESVGAAYGRQLPDKDCQIIERYTRSFNYPAQSRVKAKDDLQELGIKTFFCSNVCAAYRKSVYVELGGFERKTIFNEDMIMAGKIIQNGYKVAYVSDAKVIHSHNYGCIQQLKRNFDLAVSQAEHPEIFQGIKSEDEGVRLVKRTAAYLVRMKRPWLIGPLIMKSASKYLGYKLGRNYSVLPQWVVMKCTMNPRYWAKHK